MRRLRPIHVAYALIFCFFFLERLLRQGQSAKSWQEGSEDEGSTRAVGSAFGMAITAILLAPILNRFRLGRIRNEKLAWSGVVAMLAGIIFRGWANRVLGAYYTRTLRTQQGQHLITAGPYRLIRHPGYVGSLLLWVGAGIASANWIVAAVSSAPLARAYLRRMEAEEAMLARTFPQEYPGYIRRTWRLIPFIY